jgi:hypothetical protein
LQTGKWISASSFSSSSQGEGNQIIIKRMDTRIRQKFNHGTSLLYLFNHDILQVKSPSTLKRLQEVTVKHTPNPTTEGIQ